MEVESITEVVPILESGDSFTVRSKRSALAIRGPTASPAVESDPYRKVGSSSFAKQFLVFRLHLLLLIMFTDVLPFA